jgi:hypothetical protein
MSDEPIKPYAFYLQSEWTEIILLSTDLRKQMIIAMQDDEMTTGEIDQTILIDFAARLTRLWLEVYPKVNGREDFGKVKETFLSFEKYTDPSMTLKGVAAGVSKESIANLFLMEMSIRDVLDKLGITTW